MRAHKHATNMLHEKALALPLPSSVLRLHGRKLMTRHGRALGGDGPSCSSNQLKFSFSFGMDFAIGSHPFILPKSIPIIGAFIGGKELFPAKNFGTYNLISGIPLGSFCWTMPANGNGFGNNGGGTGGNSTRGGSDSSTGGGGDSSTEAEYSSTGGGGDSSTGGVGTVVATAQVALHCTPMCRV